MKHTNNYHLPQWSEDDLILMEDFNQMNRDIESGIDGAKAEAAEARAVADSAKVTANAAHQTAGSAYSPTNKPYAVGHYVGTGADQVINVGFRPSFVIVVAIHNAPSIGSTGSGMFYFNAITGGHTLTDKVVFTDTGIVLKKETSDNVLYPQLTRKDTIYEYILFR